ncbi:hypothetical protein FOMG_19180 [Fusarium oxysporum f. sp. melonis 26406]|uniref:Uncharacterized protein n=1 Tax=Fusarium oxysporum f. sp. melonis 26406 TaxID=1089452 RepID=W9Z755_FUSOX|nr:hypothetical protein FOMG_19180 [Fusarium oxysporum f. sp. melonis 26406]
MIVEGSLLHWGMGQEVEERTSRQLKIAADRQGTRGGGLYGAVNACFHLIGCCKAESCIATRKLVI